MKKEDIHLDQLYKDWFLDYASYVILERAVPHIEDGLKPVQRRILHSLWELEDGRFNKVANVVGHTMKYHPHGDASITDALVQMGQKELVIDTQGNWGSIVTGDDAAAARYIEARLTKLAHKTVFNPKLTSWHPSYDGRNKEPDYLPVKFPLLLASGAEGIAVGLSCKILPHNVKELLEACIKVLQEKPTRLYPDFSTGGVIDVSDYRDGERGGRVRVRAKIEIRSRSLLAITEVPFGTTTAGLMESIVAAVNKEKVKVKKIEDNTAKYAEILVHLPAGSDPQKTMDALFVFTDCEIAHSPNACVIVGEKPQFLKVTDLLKHCVARTKSLLKLELEIKLRELEEQWHFASLEKLFIEHKLYKRIEGVESEAEAVAKVLSSLNGFKTALMRAITNDDVLKLLELRFKRLSKYDTTRADSILAGLEVEMAKVKKHLQDVTGYTIKFFEELLADFGKTSPRRTEISEFKSVAAANVVVANEKLYWNKKEGFIGYNLKDQECLGPCSTLDDVAVFFDDGTMKVVKVQDKLFVGKGLNFVRVHKPGDEQTIYHMIYQDGSAGKSYAKRFLIGGVTRDKVYNLTQATENSQLKYLSALENQADRVTIKLKPGQGARKPVIYYDFATLGVKNRSSQGNIVTKFEIGSITPSRVV